MASGYSYEAHFIKSIYQLCGKPIMCCESALYQLGLSTYVDRNLTFLNKYQDLDAGHFSYVKEDMDFKDIITLDNGYRVTTAERTICDMIRWDRCEEFLYQGLTDYIYDNKDLALLLKKAEEYGVINQLNDLIKEINESPPYWSN